MVVSMKLNKDPFTKIAERTKTVELRLLDEKRKSIRVGDFIKFSDLSSTNIVITKVVGLTFANNFEELFEKIDDKVSMGFSENATVKEMISDMELYYSKKEQSQYGVVGIGIDVIFSTSDIYRIIKKDNFEKDVAFDFYLLHDEVRNAFQAYKYNRKEFGSALAYVAASLLGIANVTGYDLFEEIEKEFKNIKMEKLNDMESKQSEAGTYSSAAVRDYFIDGPK